MSTSHGGRAQVTDCSVVRMTSNRHSNDGQVLNLSSELKLGLYTRIHLQSKSSIRYFIY